MKKVTLWTLMLCLLAMTASGCALVSAARGSNGDGDPLPDTSPAQVKEPEQEKVTLVLYFADADAAKVEAETREVVLETTLAETIVRELVKGPQSENLGRTLPEGTELLGLVIEDGVATVDFSRELQTNHWGGSTGELMTIQSIVASLAELEEVEAVQLLIEGEKEEAIFGHGCTLEPIEPDSNYITR